MMGLVLLLAILLIVWCGIWLIRRRAVTEYRAETLFQTVKVQRKAAVRSLCFDSNGQQGAIDLRAPDKLLFPYQQGFLLYRCLLPEVNSFLSIGVGTGTALGSVRRLHPDAKICGVEIDAEVIRVAQKFFQCPDDDQALYYARDGRRFLELDAEDGQYDLVFLDAYADDRIPARLETVEFVHLLKRKMTEHGVVCVNLISSVRGGESSYLRQIWRTYREVYQHVLIVPTSPLAWDCQNILLFATDAPVPTKEQMYKQIGSWPWPQNKRRLYRMASRMFLPFWQFEGEKPLTDEQVRIFAQRSTRS